MDASLTEGGGSADGSPVDSASGERAFVDGGLRDSPLADARSRDVSTEGCSGSPNVCQGYSITSCCNVDPGPATCTNDMWMCGSWPAPGQCNGTTTCTTPSACVGRPPGCWGFDSNACCLPDPLDAMCVGTQWMCGSVPSPGCNGLLDFACPDTGANVCTPGLNQCLPVYFSCCTCPLGGDACSGVPATCLPTGDSGVCPG
jgi:hypothetical protein